ncbi:MAG: glycosyltransferase [Candidatus Aegiribacteria sp.]|nr:glycosyltransferase [Candidatus Aegiribacteria sp.]
MKISVVIPVYNAEQFVRSAVVSALDQPETAEVILAEDNSTDDSLVVCRSLEKEYSRVSLIRHSDGENHGAGATRNLGVRNATMEYLAFLDADDYYLADRFKVAAELFNMHENIDGVYEAIGVCFEDEEAENRWKSYENSNITTLSKRVCPDKLCNLLLEGGKGTFSLDGLTVRKIIFEKCGFFFENLRLHQDYAMNIQMAQFGRLYPGRLNTPVAMRRVHAGNRIISDYNRYFTSSLLWKTLFNWAMENKLQTDRTIPIFLHHLYFIYCVVIDRHSGKGIDIQELRILILEVLRHPILFIRALSEHFRRKTVR